MPRIGGGAPNLGAGQPELAKYGSSELDRFTGGRRIALLRVSLGGQRSLRICNILIGDVGLAHSLYSWRGKSGLNFPGRFTP